MGGGPRCARTHASARIWLACGFRHARLARRRACACLHREMCSVRPRQRRASTLQARFAAPRSPGADVAGPSPVPAQMWQRSGSRNYTRPIYSRNARQRSAVQWFSSLCPMCGSKVEGYVCELYEVCSMRSDACRTVCAARRASNMRSVLQLSGACCLLMFSVACCKVTLRVACLHAV